MLGDEDGDDHEVIILNRTIRWEIDSIRYEADSKHVEEIATYFGLGSQSKWFRYTNYQRNNGGGRRRKSTVVKGGVGRVSRFSGKGELLVSRST